MKRIMIDTPTNRLMAATLAEIAAAESFVHRDDLKTVSSATAYAEPEPAKSRQVRRQEERAARKGR